MKTEKPSDKIIKGKFGIYISGDKISPHILSEFICSVNGGDCEELQFYVNDKELNELKKFIEIYQKYSSRNKNL